MSKHERVQDLTDEMGDIMHDYLLKHEHSNLALADVKIALGYLIDRLDEGFSDDGTDEWGRMSDLC